MLTASNQSFEISEIKRKEYEILVAVDLMTDGSLMVKKCRNTRLVEFYTNDLCLHLEFQNLMKFAFGRDKVSYFQIDKLRGRGRLTITGYELSKNDLIIKYLLDLSPTYRTGRNNLKIPAVRFLFQQNNRIKELAVRFAMSCDGGMSVAHLKSGKIITSLKFACAHPSLVLEWKSVFAEIGIHTFVDKDRANWSGIHGLVAKSRQSITRFQEIGGFYPTAVEVQNGNYKGIPKNQVLDGICAWLKNKHLDIDKVICENKATL